MQWVQDVIMSSLFSKMLCCLQFGLVLDFHRRDSLWYRIHGAWMSHFSGYVGGEVQTALLDNKSFADISQLTQQKIKVMQRKP